MLFMTSRDAPITNALLVDFEIWTSPPKSLRAHPRQRAAVAAKVKKLMFPGASCTYPRNARQLAARITLAFIDAAVLFTVVVAMSVVPITVGCWVLRKISVLTLLGDYGIRREQALSLPVSSGTTNSLASLPGAFAWVLYSSFVRSQSE